MHIDSQIFIYIYIIDIYTPTYAYAGVYTCIYACYACVCEWVNTCHCNTCKYICTYVYVWHWYSKSLYKHYALPYIALHCTMFQSITRVFAVWNVLPRSSLYILLAQVYKRLFGVFTFMHSQNTCVHVLTMEAFEMPSPAFVITWCIAPETSYLHDPPVPWSNAAIVNQMQTHQIMLWGWGRSSTNTLYSWCHR